MIRIRSFAASRSVLLPRAGHAPTERRRPADRAPHAAPAAREPTVLCAAQLLACPFCGGTPAWEAHEDFPEAARIACASALCGVRPRTEYLLTEFAAELAAAWNARSPVPPSAERFR